jgi:hypothetical protein
MSAIKKGASRQVELHGLNVPISEEEGYQVVPRFRERLIRPVGLDYRRQHPRRRDLDNGLLRSCSEPIDQSCHTHNATVVLALGEFASCYDQPGCGRGGLSLCQIDFSPEESEARDDVHKPARIRQG